MENMMKALVTIISIATGILYADPIATIPDGGTLVDEANQLVETLIVKHPNPRNDSVMVEIVRTSAEFIQLGNLCKANWDSVLDNLDAVISGDTGKSMIITVFEERLDADDYMTVLEYLSDRFQKGQISISLMKAALSPLGRMQSFLPYNYRNTRVRELLNNLKPYFRDDADTQSWITGVLSGEQKKWQDGYRKAHKNLLASTVPQLPLDETSKTYTVIPKRTVGYLFVASIFTAGVIMAWRCFRKRWKRK